MSDATTVRADDSVVDASGRRRVRKNPAARRAEIVQAARAVFAERGYENAGLSDISDAATVSKALLYHYFPEGRPAIYAAVTDEVLGELHEQLTVATKLPFSPRRRMEHLVGTLFSYFGEHPDAYRQLFTLGLASPHEVMAASAIAARVEVTAELAAILTTIRRPADDQLAASAGILGFLLANLELCLSGQLEAETALRVTCEYATSMLES